MLTLVLHNLLRRPLRHGLTLAGVALAVAVLVCITAFGNGYRQTLRGELDRAGLQIMLVPTGCPYDAAARVLKNNTLENSLPASALDLARRDPAVAVAAPFLMAALPRTDTRRTDLWVGLDETALPLKPWWRVTAGRTWFNGPDEVILGADAAALEMRAPGDKFFSPETRREFRVAGVLERSGTSDDNVFFIPLATAQAMFAQTGRLTAIAIRLKDPALVREAAPRLQEIHGAQVVTMTEMMGTFLNLLGAVRTLLLALGVIALTVGALSVFNTLLAGVVERSGELALLRALGASRAQVFALITGESLLLAGVGGALGLAIALAGGPALENLVRPWVPFAPAQPLLALDARVLLNGLALALAAGGVAGIYPAWRASRLSPALAVKMK
jgi:putative ABC transport system permease protein